MTPSPTVSDSPGPDPLRASRVTGERPRATERGLVLLLILCAGWMTLGGPRVDLEDPLVSARPDVPPSVPTESAQMLLHVEGRLAASNPLLAERERTRIATAVLRYSEQYGLDPELVTAIVLVESNARPWAYSPKGAIGLMQVMPHMMQPLQLAGNAATIESNIEAGCRILADNIRRLGVDDGVSAYFWGNDIRGVAYLEKVREKLESIRRARPS